MDRRYQERTYRTPDQIPELPEYRATAHTLGEALKNARARVRDCVLADAGLPALFEGTEGGLAARLRALELLELTHLPGEDSRVRKQFGLKDDERTPKGRGVLGASPETLAAIRALNTEKAAFSEALDRMPGRVSVPGDSADGPIFVWRYVLDRVFGHAFSWHLACRKIHDVAWRPWSMGYTFGATRSVKRITIAEARGLLEDREVKKRKKVLAIQSGLAYLEGQPGQKHVALVTQHAGHWRLNVRRGPEELEALQRQFAEAGREDIPSPKYQIVTPIPVFVALRTGESLPPVRHLNDEPKEGGRRGTRTDTKLASRPVVVLDQAQSIYEYVGRG